MARVGARMLWFELCDGELRRHQESGINFLAPMKQKRLLTKGCETNSMVPT